MLTTNDGNQCHWFEKAHGVKVNHLTLIKLKNLNEQLAILIATYIYITFCSIYLNLRKHKQDYYNVKKNIAMCK